MDAQKVDAFLMVNAKYLPEVKIPAVREMLLTMDDSRSSMLATVQFKDPVIALVLSLFLGGLGIDRFYIGNTGLGVGKLLTCGGFGVWTFIDFFFIMGATRECNLEKLMLICK